MNQRALERFRIAFGLNATDVDDDPLPRAAAMKAWHAKWDKPIAYGGSYMKSVTGGPVTFGSATKSYSAPRRRKPIHAVVENHSIGNSSVELWRAGDDFTASGFAVKSVRAAGVDRFGNPLVELETAIGNYTVDQAALED